MFAALLILTTLGIWHWRLRGRPWYVLPAGILLLLFCWPPPGMLVLRVVQGAYSRQPPDPQDAGAVVILAGAVHEPFPPRPFYLLTGDTLERCSYGIWYQRRTNQLPLLLVGGAANHEKEPYSATMKAYSLAMGMPESLLWIEDRSRSTAENALYSARILRSKAIGKIVLVTDVVHMTRASKSFAKQGISVIPAPCCFRPVYTFDAGYLLPSWRAILWNEQLIHEWIGLAWYRLRGYL